jgi:hypothetical protein
MMPAAYETVNTEDEPASQTGLPGKVLFRFTEIVRWYFWRSVFMVSQE